MLENLVRLYLKIEKIDDNNDNQRTLLAAVRMYSKSGRWLYNMSHLDILLICM